MRKWVVTVLTAVMCFSCMSCSNNKEPEEVDEYAKYDYADGFTARPLAENGYDVVTVNIEIPGLDREYHYIIGADLHIISNDLEEVADDQKSTVRSRIKMFMSDKNGFSAAKQWEKLPDYLNQCGADCIFFNADMIDFNSQANVDALKAGFDKLTTTFYYLRADHDCKPTYLEDSDKSKANKRQNEICPNDELFELEYDRFIILCINNSLTNTKKEKLNDIKAVFAKGKPVILVSHVPFESESDPTLVEKDSGIFGEHTGYEYFDSGMYEFIDTVTAEDSPVIYVLSGHTHFNWSGSVNGKINQTIFDCLSDYCIGLVNVVPAKK